MSRFIENVEEVVLAVENQDEVVDLFEELFDIEFKDSWTVPIYDMGVKSAQIGSTQFQVISSTSPDGLVAKFIQDRGEGMHHIAFRVKNLDELITRLKNKGVKLVPEEPKEMKSSRFIFVHPKSAHGLLIELIEWSES